MENLGVMGISILMILVGMVAGCVNTYLIMQLINATTTMWVLWIVSIILIIIGEILFVLSK